MPYTLDYYESPTLNDFVDISDIQITNQATNISNSLLNSGFNLDNMGKIDGSSYLIDLDNNGTTDLISLLILDGGYFDTRPDEIGVIGDPIIPVQVELNNPEVEIANQSPSEVTNANSINNASNKLSSNNLKLTNANPNNIFSRSINIIPSNFIKSSINQEEENGIDIGISSNLPEFSSPFPLNFSNSNQIPLPRKSGSNNKFSTLPLSNLSSSVSIASIFGFIIGPLAIERTTTIASKQIKRVPNLRINRRNEEFQGKWLIPDAKSKRH